MKYMSILLPFVVSLTSPAYAQVKAAPEGVFEVSYAQIEEVVSIKLVEKGVGDKVSALINGHKNSPASAFDKPVAISVRGLEFDKPSQHWSANILFLSGEDVVTAMPFSGHFDELLETPVMKREIRSGAVITPADIEIRDFPITRTRSDTISDIASLIGKSPLHSISPYRPIRESEVISPALIKKNAIVQMRYHVPGMDISTSGEAMSQGAKGEIINVRNVTSKKIVRAMVEDSDSVSILPLTEKLSDNATALASTNYATN